MHLARLLSAFVTISLLSPHPANAQIVDFDRTFAGALPGRTTVFHDVANSYKADRAIAAFPDASGGYVVVSRISADPNGYYNIGIARLARNGMEIAKINDGGDYLDVLDACQDPSGRLLVAATYLSGGAAYGVVERFSANGLLDPDFGLSFSVGDGTTKIMRDLVCLDDNTVVALYAGRDDVDLPQSFHIVKLQHSPQPSGNISSYPAPAGGFWDARSLTQTANGRWITLSIHDSNDTPLRIRALTGNTLPGLLTATDIDPTQCGLTLPMQLDAPVVKAQGNRIHAFGTAMDPQNEWLWRLSADMLADGTLANVRCGIEPRRSPGLLTWFYEFGDALVDPLGDVYVIGTYHPDNFGTARQRLQRYRADANGLLQLDPHFGSDGRIEYDFSRSAINPGPYRDLGEGLMFDARGGYQVVAFGAAEWQENAQLFSPADTDSTITVFSNQPLFGNGFE